MTEKKIDKKVNEEQEALKEQELDKVTGGQDDYPYQPKTKGGNVVTNSIYPYRP